MQLTRQISAKEAVVCLALVTMEWKNITPSKFHTPMGITVCVHDIYVVAIKGIEY